MFLNTIRDNPGARIKRRRVGRGIGSGRGKTSTRGGKGQTARSGVALNGFEGGQTPLHRRLPKRGFVPYRRKRYVEVTLAQLENAIEKGHLDPAKEITADILKESRVISRCFQGVRLLGGGEIQKALTLCVVGASRSTIQAVEKAGGTVSFVGACDLRGAESKIQASDS